MQGVGVARIDVSRNAALTLLPMEVNEVQVTFTIRVRTEHGDEVFRSEADASIAAIRMAARELNSKIALVLQGPVQTIATVVVDDGAEIFINLGETDDQYTTEADARRIA